MVTLRRECPLSSSAYRRSHLHTDWPHLHMLSGTLSTFQGVRSGPSCPSPSVPAEGGAPVPAACLGLGLSVFQRQPTLCGSSPTWGGWCLAFLSCSEEFSLPPPRACQTPSPGAPFQPGGHQRRPRLARHSASPMHRTPNTQSVRRPQRLLLGPKHKQADLGNFLQLTSGQTLSLVAPSLPREQRPLGPCEIGSRKHPRTENLPLTCCLAGLTP